MKVRYDPGEPDHRQFQSNDVGMAFAESRPARHSQNSRNPFHAGDDFRGFPQLASLHLLLHRNGLAPYFLRISRRFANVLQFHPQQDIRQRSRRFSANSGKPLRSEERLTAPT